MLWDLSRRPGHRRAGVGIGLAAAVKLTPGLFAVFLLATGLAARARHRSGGPWLRHARGAAVAFTGATLLAAAVLPYDSWRFWTRMVFAAGRVGHPEDTANQPCAECWPACCTPRSPAPGGSPRRPSQGRWASRSRWPRSCAGGAAGRWPRSSVTALLICPVSWSHHWVWCVPMVLVTARRRAVAVGMALVFCSYALWWVPHGPGRLELRQNGVELTLSALYAAAGLLFLALSAVETLRPSQDVGRKTKPNDQAVTNE
ncbi:glycosyltransferase family 87 protein [Streptomyces sp. CA-210063]|uniref:glycosyltransferase family 87 protein n=1 Tax=Streptomyces sp. CA-210063 TaxID=2801029 RepID=UPI003FA692F5